MRLLLVQPSVNPAMGGTAEIVYQLGTQLQRLGSQIEVLSLDDAKQPYVQRYALKLWALGPSTGTYGLNARLVPWLKRNAIRFDAVIVNGIWQYHSVAVWRALRKRAPPYYVFPHGMLDPWFKHTYPLKHLKKWLYWPWAEYRVLRDAAGVLYSCEEEMRLARQSFWLYRAHEHVVTLGIGAPQVDPLAARHRFLQHFPQLQNRRLLLFLARIHEKKGADLLVRAFAEIAAQDASLSLMMAGPDESGLRASLERLASDLGVAGRIVWPGMLQGELKWGALHSAEAFLLPSHQENFGVAVIEALACGRPVIISDKINIWREIERDGAGLVTADTLVGTVQGLRRWLALSETQRAEMRARAASCFQQRFTIAATAAGLLRVVRATIEQPRLAGGSTE